MWVFGFGTIRSCPVDFLKGFLTVVVLALFLDLFNLTSVRGFDYNSGLILLFETTGLVFIFVSVMSSTFNKLLFVLTVGVTRNISDPNRSYSNISKSVPIDIFLIMVI